jgi:hypothetical protein
MIVGAFMGVVGNAIHGYAIDQSSVSLSIVARLCFGFSSAEILQREVMTMCAPAHVVAESGQLMISRMMGAVAGLIIGTLSAIPIAIQSIDVGRIYSPHTRPLQSASWVLMLFWLLHLIRISVQLQIADDGLMDPTRHNDSKKNEQDASKPTPTANKESDSESSSSAEIRTPSSVLYRPALDVIEPIANAATTMERHAERESTSNQASSLSRREDDIQGAGIHHRRRITRHWKYLGRLRKLLLFHIGIPIALLVYVFSSFAMEVFCTATPFITDRYFAWSGERVGAFLGCLVAASLPLSLVCEIIARRYEERAILKVGG